MKIIIFFTLPLERSILNDKTISRIRTLLLSVYSEAASMNFTMILYYMIFSRASSFLHSGRWVYNEPGSRIQLPSSKTLDLRVKWKQILKSEIEISAENWAKIQRQI